MTTNKNLSRPFGIKTLTAVALAKMKWKRIKNDTKTMLAAEVSVLSAFNPAYNDARALLLAIGGIDARFAPDDDIVKIASRSQSFFDVPIQMILGDPSRCHWNAAKLWNEDKSNRQIVTGFAISDDGLWRLHSWAWDGSKVIETTEARLAYWGCVLTPAECEEFTLNLRNVDIAHRAPHQSPPPTGPSSVAANVAKMEKSMAENLNGAMSLGGVVALSAYRAGKDHPRLLCPIGNGDIGVVDLVPGADFKDGHSASRNLAYGELCKLVEDDGGAYVESGVYPPGGKVWNARGPWEDVAPGHVVAHLFRGISYEALSAAVREIFGAQDDIDDSDDDVMEESEAQSAA